MHFSKKIVPHCGMHGGVIKRAIWRCKNWGLLLTSKGENKATDRKQLRRGTKITSLQGDDAGVTGEPGRKDGNQTLYREGRDKYRTSGMCQWVPGKHQKLPKDLLCARPEADPCVSYSILMNFIL